MESTTTFCVRFILRHNPGNTTEARIYARISINGKRIEIYANRSIHPDCWNPQRQCVVGSKELVSRINPHLEQIRYKLNDCYQQLKMQNAFITGDSIKRIYFGEEIPYNSLMSLFDYHATSTKGILKPGTLKNYGATEKL